MDDATYLHREDCFVGSGVAFKSLTGVVQFLDFIGILPCLFSHYSLGKKMVQLFALLGAILPFVFRNAVCYPLKAYWSQCSWYTHYRRLANWISLRYVGCH